MVIIWLLVSFIKFAFGELREIERIVLKIHDLKLLRTLLIELKEKF